MADYVLRGTEKLISYARAQAGVNMSSIADRLAGVGSGLIPRIHLNGNGVPGSQWISRRYSEPEAQAIAGLLGQTVANVTTNGGQEIVG